MNDGGADRGSGVAGRPPTIVRSLTGFAAGQGAMPGGGAALVVGERTPGKGVPMAPYGGMRWTSAGVPIARLWGELDVANAPVVFAAISEAVGGAEVIVDFTEVTFIDSSVLAELLVLAGVATVRIVAPPGRQPRRVLDVTRLVDTLGSFDSVDAALEAG